MSHRRLGLVLAAFAVAVAACSGGGEGADDTTTSATSTSLATTTSVPEPQGLSVSASEHSFAGVPASVPEGLVHADLTNTGAEVHQAAILRLKEGVTPEQIVEAAGDDPTARDVFKLVEAAGGPNTAAPGGGVSAGTVALAAGSYVLACLIPASDGELHAAKGMVTPFTVTANPSGPPDTTFSGGVGDITAADFSYTTPPGLTGGGVFTFVNAGAQTHELTVWTVPEGARIGQVREYFDALAAGDDPPTNILPPTPLSGVAPLAPFGHAQVELPLVPGHYAFVCFLTDPTTGQNHETLGMFQAITIEE